MDEREKRKKVIFIIFGIIIVILLFFLMKSCSSSDSKKTTKDINIIDVKTESLSLVVGDSDKLLYSIIPSNAVETTKWISSDDSVVSVDASGNIRALKNGNAIVSLVSESGVSDYTVVKVVSKTTVEGNDVTVNILEKDVNIKVGSTKKMLFDIIPQDTPYNELLWESSNNLVATITNDGIVSGLRSGVTTITLKAILNDNSTITDSATLTVEENTNLYLTSTIDDIKEGETVRAVLALSDASLSIYNGSVKSSNEKTLTASNVSFETSYLTVDIKGIKKGTATLKASVTTSEGKDLSLDIPINVIGFNDLYISSGDKEIKIGESFVLSGRMEPSVSGSLDTICTSSNNSNATAFFADAVGEYNGSCQITGIKKGTSNISISIGGKKKTIKVTISEDDLTDPDNPDNSEDPTGPDNFNADKTLTAIEATLSKTEYERNEAMGTLTVSTVFSDGSKGTLASNEYVLINDFDSTTLGSKTLNIAYTKDGETKVTSVAYTIKGGSASSLTTIAGASGYGGGSGNGNNSSGVDFSTGGLNVLSTPDENGKYRGKIKTELIDQNYKDEYEYVAVTYECTGTEEQCKDFKSEDVYGTSSDHAWKIVSLQLVDVKDGRGTFEIGAETEGARVQAVVFRNPKGRMDENGDGIIDEDKTFYHATRDWNLKVAFKDGTILINVDVDSTNSKDTCGIITYKTNKAWYGKNDKTAVINITVKSSDNWSIESVTFANEPPIIIDQNVFTRGIDFDLQNVDTTITFPVNATMKKGEEKCTVGSTIRIHVDKVKPNCKAILDSTNSTAVTVTGYEGLMESGIDKIESNFKNSQYKLIMQNQFSKTVSYPIIKSGTYDFTVTDVAENTNTCSVEVEPFKCYRDKMCATNSCRSCYAAGCLNLGEKVRGKYDCNGLDRWLAGKFDIKNGVVIDDKRYESFSNSIGVQCKLYDTGKNIICSEDGKESTGNENFGKSCLFCGCGAWNDTSEWKPLESEELSTICSADKLYMYQKGTSEYSDCRESSIDAEEWQYEDCALKGAKPSELQNQ